MSLNPSDSYIYLDNHATTPMDPRVFQKIAPFFSEHFGNAASVHHPYGWYAQEAVDQARIQFARAINADPSEIIFTSGATEATNLALKGLFLSPQSLSTRHILSSAIEHNATLSTLQALKEHGVSSSLINPSPEGEITLENLNKSLEKTPGLVSLFLVNHEIGVVNNIKLLGQAIKKSGALFHCDATQALGRIKINCQELPVDMMSFSAHKIYGPKGVGALYIRKETLAKLYPLIHGGGQEWQKRSGTLNVPGIVGLGEAAFIAAESLESETARIKLLRDKLLSNLSTLGQVYINGSLENRVSGNLNISFGSLDGEELILSICKRIAVSTGSACASMHNKSSSVLEHLGISAELRQATLRFGIGRFNSLEEINIASELICAEVKKQRTKLTRNKNIKLTR